MITSIKLIQFLSSLGSLFWVLLGLLSIGGITLSTSGWLINVVMGILFIAVGCFFYARGRSFVCFYQSHIKQGLLANQSLKRFIRLEIVLLLGNCFVSALLLAAGASRVFGEGFAIFG